MVYVLSLSRCYNVILEAKKSTHLKKILLFNLASTAKLFYKLRIFLFGNRCTVEIFFSLPKYKASITS